MDFIKKLGRIAPRDRGHVSEIRRADIRKASARDLDQTAAMR
jgi:hypothetical protein